MNKVLLFWLIMTLVKYSIMDESCSVEHKPKKFQVVFVVDYIQNKDAYEYKRWQPETAKHVMDFVLANFPLSEFGLTGFVNYPHTADPQAREITNPDWCYFLMQNFTNNSNKIVEKLKEKVVTKPEDYNPYGKNKSSSFATALLMTAVERGLNWQKGFYTEKGELVRKVLVSMTWLRITSKLLNPGNRTVPKADGTDTCGSALIPTDEQLHRVLVENGFIICNTISKSVEVGDMEIHYTDFFSRFTIPYYQFPFPEPGKWHESHGNYDYKAHAKLIYDAMLGEAMSCDWEDPVGYNTLGI